MKPERKMKPTKTEIIKTLLLALDDTFEHGRASAYVDDAFLERRARSADKSFRRLLKLLGITLKEWRLEL